MQLIICEKPSVGMTISSALGIETKKDGYMESEDFLVSWCIGHLAELSAPSCYGKCYEKWSLEALPILPETWQLTVSKDKEKQFSILKALLFRKDVTEVINSCDAGREGELIFRFVMEKTGCKKPVKRLWISSMEESAIRKGFENLKDGADYDSLYQSALCRAKADWIVGINATRLFSLLYNHTLNVGRVQSPTLKILADRSDAITNFKKEKYYHVHLVLDGTEAVSDRFSSKEAAEKIATSCKGKTAVCTSITSEKKEALPPKLFDLTALQKEANRIFGYTAKQTLDLAQSLYEKKLLTYPRTDSNYLTDDMKETADKVIIMLLSKLSFMQSIEFTPEITRLLNSKKVSDHHAVIPTMEFQKTELSLLPESERNILFLAGARLLMASAASHIYETVTAVFNCEDHTFTAKGKTVLSSGWKEIEALFLMSLKEKPDKENEKELPAFCDGESFDSFPIKVTEHDTLPPKAYTESTLLSSMERAGNKETTEDAERKGLGTPATRSAIIEKIIKAGFVTRKGKQLIPTKDGMNLISVLPETLTSPLLTAEWENELSRIAKGEADADSFMKKIEALTKELIKNADAEKVKAELFKQEKTVIGLCPRCQNPVYEGKKNYYCSNRDCNFSMWKNDRFFEDRKITFTPKIASVLLKDKKVKVKGIYSNKTGKTYDGNVVLCDTKDKYVNYRIEIERKKKEE
ncbi:DNA topoisomerase 3 [Fusobacterium necrophorum]|uniref:DNA topoisomerase n=2 Tax=Fusobacterium necrophorum TaxID=859 RepID=A0AAW6W856_9FUSO|nr:DNA topoisomerase 3 [Fusobacterium necrophorum]KYM39198.1 DNA topoisomerase III [Fusobacterium necrophorum subsp. funduliforme]KYM48788.1 DNA topoisomerase III [Fusobacterium necrophorum subsp. funduliforme]KYM52668.1 DNA topoisomerase III [Fusobacterium necrophorum subsp. funduliforme]KYM52772.1 DNA topoisomerase III [Fusobacterium necrophorum subsp. funduliforme]KYM54993.1 DNA topoisomerase III [Fusobacterium necrophorum subsp. funduliforme]